MFRNIYTILILLNQGFFSSFLYLGQEIEGTSIMVLMIGVALQQYPDRLRMKRNHNQKAIDQKAS